MPDKLVEIMAWKRKEIASRIRAVSEGELARLDGSLPKPPPLQAALVRTDGTLAVIAEIKRRSPSAGEIAAGASAVERARAYHAAGANALSVLTDGKYFGGELQDLEQVTEDLRASAIPLPCLRKDFMVHPIQVLEARQSGASAVLLIVRALDDEEIRVLHGAAVAAGLDALFEVHTQQELGRAVAHGARLIGVNNRDLSAFTTDLSLSERLIPLFPPGVVAISESGINSAADASRVRKAGARAVLVGESLMRSPDPSGLLAAIRSA
ncbi:MAG TPA: indole-3-glycerol phosphate synthase TrpC [Opitutaceae bacterium]